jgi:hypothetical protein
MRVKTIPVLTITVTLAPRIVLVHREEQSAFVE